MKKTILAALVISTMLMGSTAVYAAPDISKDFSDSIAATACTEAVLHSSTNTEIGEASQNGLADMVAVTTIKDGQIVSSDKMMTLCTPAIFKVDSMEKVFFAEEITANGKNVKVQN